MNSHRARNYLCAVLSSLVIQAVTACFIAAFLSISDHGICRSVNKKSEFFNKITSIKSMKHSLIL